MKRLSFITSNSERQLPDAFLRRCVFHHIQFDEDLLKDIVESHKAGFARLGDDVISFSLTRFIDLTRRDDFRKKPATSELLVWLRTLALWLDAEPEKLEHVRLQLSDNTQPLPCSGVLFKDRNDLEIAQFGY
uniref:AAA ATPase n=1 Tax=uncultured Thiotrichaceae bacterium TaxID=298394 RepID=A0A6S6SEL2_9GAMM|nr:MAG: AAA ATPase [uncultured Thiotrichaceae bacterium]